MLVLSCLPSLALAKSYRVHAIDVDAEITSRGELLVKESMTYRFNGDFSYAFREIPLADGESISDIRLSENGRYYEETGDERPSSFNVHRWNSGLKITWYYRASNEERRFVLTYTVSGVVKRYSDVGELYHKFVGDDWDRMIGRVGVRITLPGRVDPSEIRAWAHGPRLLDGGVSINPDGSVSLDVSRLPRHTYWEARVLFPALALSDAPLYADESRSAAVMVEEAAWAERANRLRKEQLARQEMRRLKREALQARAKTYLPVAIFLALVGLALWTRAFIRHGKAHSVRSHTVRGDIPSDHPPAIVSYLMFRDVAGTGIVATLLDLTDRGYFTINETVREKSSFFGKRTEKDYRFDRTDKLWKDLETYELDLAEFLITEVGDVTGFTMSALKRSARKKRSKFLKWFQAWRKSVKATGKQLDFYEPFAKKAMVTNALTGVGIAAIGAFLSLHSQSGAGLPAIIGGILVAVVTVALTRRTVEGQKLLIGWRGFHRHLKDVSKGMGPVTLDSRDWSRYLGAAILFGVHKKLLPKLNLSDDGVVHAYPAWYVGALGGSGGDIASLADGLSTMVSSVTTTVSSASGTGGGASVGGGGGSGGGGGGAG